MSQQEATFCRLHCGLWASRRRIPQEATRLREALLREGYGQGASHPMPASGSVECGGQNPGGLGGPRRGVERRCQGPPLCTTPSAVLIGLSPAEVPIRIRNRTMRWRKARPSPVPLLWKDQGLVGLMDHEAIVVSGAGCRRDSRTAGISLALQEGCLHVATSSPDDGRVLWRVGAIASQGWGTLRRAHLGWLQMP